MPITAKTCRMTRANTITELQNDGEALVLGLNMLLTSRSRRTACNIARSETTEKITSAALRTEMLEAIDLLEERFTLKQ
jgi:hypothetical protein